MATVTINGRDFKFSGKSIPLEKIINQFNGGKIHIEDIDGDLIIDSAKFTGCSLYIEDIHGDLNINNLEMEGCNFNVEDVSGDVNISSAEKLRPAVKKNEQSGDKMITLNGRWINIPVSDT